MRRRINHRLSLTNRAKYHRNRRPNPDVCSFFHFHSRASDFFACVQFPAYRKVTFPYVLICPILSFAHHFRLSPLPPSSITHILTPILVDRIETIPRSPPRYDYVDYSPLSCFFIAICGCLPIRSTRLDLYSRPFCGASKRGPL